MNIWKKIVLPAIILVLLDAGFINMNINMFNRQIVQVQRVVATYKTTGIILCYALMIFALCYFIIIPHRPVLDAFLLGLVIHGIFETTNYALFKHWQLQMVIIDTLWGGALYGLTTLMVYSL